MRLQKPWGDIECWEYIDDLKEAMQYWYVRYAIDKYGVEDTMPICMNKADGYHRFVANKERATNKIIVLE